MQFYAKTGVTIDPGCGFIFTGNSNGDNWEVDLPIASEQIHGYANNYISDSTLSDAILLGTGPVIVKITENIAAKDILTSSTNGNFKKKGLTDSAVGIALTAGNINDVCAALIFWF